MKKKILFLLAGSAALSCSIYAASPAIESHASVSDEIIAQQRANLETNTAGKGFGPQAPRDIDAVAGSNTVVYNMAPAHTEMNLCNIHFHKNAEHKGGEFTTYAGNGDGQGSDTGYKYSGTLSRAESAPLDNEV